MTVAIPSELDAFVRQALASGRYRSETELVADALRLLRNRDRKWDALREDIQAGLQDLDEGGAVPLDFEDIKRRGRESLTQTTTRS